MRRNSDWGYPSRPWAVGYGLGASLALFDVAAAVLKASGHPKVKVEVSNAMKHLAVDTPLGRLAWGRGPLPPNVVATPIIGGQWRTVRGSKYPLDFIICEHSSNRRAPITRMATPILQAVAVGQRFGALVVLDAVDFAL